MATLADRVYDNGLVILDTEASRLDICSQEPTTYAEATTTYTLGNATSISIGAPSDRSGGGRQVTLSAVSGGAVSNTGTATHYALTDVSNSRLLATGALTASQAVTGGNSFATTALSIGIPDPA